MYMYKYTYGSKSLLTVPFPLQPMRRRIHACHMRRSPCTVPFPLQPMRRRIHACHMIEEDTCPCTVPLPLPLHIHIPRPWRWKNVAVTLILRTDVVLS
jgi:hypothetical protein